MFYSYQLIVKRTKHGSPFRAHIIVESPNREMAKIRAIDDQKELGLFVESAIYDGEAETMKELINGQVAYMSGNFIPKTNPGLGKAQTNPQTPLFHYGLKKGTL